MRVWPFARGAQRCAVRDCTCQREPLDCIDAISAVGGINTDWRLSSLVELSLQMARLSFAGILNIYRRDDLGVAIVAGVKLRRPVEDDADASGDTDGDGSSNAALTPACRHGPRD
ncbi:hypothetical protein [Paraburkholderia sp. BR14264]|uniref:hypothetical protein n=1 Tax=Paraburkholderia sp. BR14264 TaxID=3237001 RepID=UPI0034D03AE8